MNQIQKITSEIVKNLLDNLGLAGCQFGKKIGIHAYVIQKSPSKKPL